MEEKEVQLLSPGNIKADVWQQFSFEKKGR